MGHCFCEISGNHGGEYEDDYFLVSGMLRDELSPR
jgi:hypothetical protein